MAKGFNKVTLVGNLTRDPELRTTSGGRSVCSFSLAVNRTWRNADGEQQEAVDFIDCVAWGKAGEIISQYMKKGRPLLVAGRLQQDTWEQDGNKRSKIEVVVEDFNFIDGGGGGNSDSGADSYDSGDGQSEKKPAAKQSKAKDGKDDVQIEDLDENVDLSEIPF